MKGKGVTMLTNLSGCGMFRVDVYGDERAKNRLEPKVMQTIQDFKDVSSFVQKAYEDYPRCYIDIVYLLQDEDFREERIACWRYEPMARELWQEGMRCYDSYCVLENDNE